MFSWYPSYFVVPDSFLYALLLRTWPFTLSFDDKAQLVSKTSAVIKKKKLNRLHCTLSFEGKELVDREIKSPTVTAEHTDCSMLVPVL